MIQRRINFRNDINTLGVFDGQKSFSETIRFKPNSRKSCRLVFASITTNIPNIINSSTVNNGLYAMTINGGVNWISAQLPTGIYTVQEINLAIQNTITQMGVLTGTTPCFTLSYNQATTLAYVVIDSTQLKATGQFGINFGYGNSLMNNLLGFTAPIITDGVTSATNYAQVDYQGTAVSLLVSGLGNLSIVNGTASNEIATIPLTNATGLNYLYPINGIVPPDVAINCPEQLSSISYQFVSRDTGLPILGFDGFAEVELVITEY